MSSPQSDVNRGLRKGTKSCTECRRRKVRCVRLSGDAKSCRQCEERGSVCVEQKSSRPRSSQTLRMSSRHRIAQLESRVAHLTNIVNRIEVRLGNIPSHIPAAETSHSPAADDSDAESSVSDFPMADRPSHLQSLFQNDWLSVESSQQGHQSDQRQGRASVHFSRVVRPSLQNLIPPREEVMDIAGCSFDWLTMLHTVLPQPCTVTCQQELLDKYEEMCRPDVDVIHLASWLLALAITAQQIPEDEGSREVYLKKCQERSQLSRNITNMVERTLLSHDRFLATVEGLGMAVHYARLHIGQGNFQKTWITLRRLIAIAELMGLPRISQAVRLKKIDGPDGQQSLQKAQLWDLLCNLERVSGMILNLPPATRRYQRTPSPPLAVDGTVQPHVYMSNMMEIATRVNELDDLSGSPACATEVHMAVEMARDLGALASQTPSSWWIFDETTPFRAEHFVQFLHYTILMRVYLPLALRQDSREENLYGRLPCIDACDTVARRYILLRRKLPPGLFVARVLDLQAFTATAVLLLTSRNPPLTVRHSFHVDTSRLQDVIAEVINLMGQRSKDPAGCELAKEAFNALCALNKLLRLDDNSSPAQTLTLKVPLLGRVHIRRNTRSMRTTMANGEPNPLTSSSRALNQSQLPATPLQNQLTYQPPTSINSAIPAGEGWQWNDFSWSIEDSPENLLTDVFMAEGMDLPPMWHDGAPNYSVPGWNMF